MTQNDVVGVIQDAVITILMVASPMLLIGLIVGLIVSIFQATTQINEQSLSFVPKIVAVFAALIIFLPWMMNKMTDLTNRLYEMINIVNR